MASLDDWLLGVLTEDKEAARKAADLEAEQSASAHLHTLDVHSQTLGTQGTGEPQRCDACKEPYPCQTVRLIGAAYEEREGYRDTWRPRSH